MTVKIVNDIGFTKYILMQICRDSYFKISDINDLGTDDILLLYDRSACRHAIIADESTIIDK